MRESRSWRRQRLEDCSFPGVRMAYKGGFFEAFT
jgi:hypothetical protein